MNKIIITLVAVLGLLAFASTVEARNNGASFIEAPASSGSVTGLSKGCDVLEVWASTDTDVGGAWFQLIATNPINVSLTYGIFSTADHRSPAVLFPSTAIASGYWNAPNYKVLDFGPEGISFATAPYVYKNGATSGQARRVWLKVRQ